MRAAWLLVPGLLFTALGWAEPRSYESAERRSTLVELYTSEGCSSCPRADRWLSTLQQDPRLWRDVVPVAFHVDYWDRLGWPDRFATPAYSKRQRNYALQGLLSTVYTPGFVVNGEEWRGWFTRPVLETDTDETTGTLRLDVDGERMQARFRPADTVSQPLYLHVAVTGSDLSTFVTDGENSGRKLEHDFVVLGYASYPLEAVDGEFQVAFRRPSSKFDAPSTAVSAWVTQDADPRPLQSVGGWID